MSVDLMSGLMEEAARLAKSATKGDANNQKNNSSKYVVLPEGNCSLSLRILPPADGKKLYCATRLHEVSSPNSQYPRRLHCPRELSQGKWYGDCPICSYYNWLWEESKKKNKSEDEVKNLRSRASVLKAKEKYYYNCIIRDEENPMPKIWSIGMEMHTMIINSMVGSPNSKKKKLGNISDINTGRDLLLVKTMRRGDNNRNYPNYNESEWQEPSVLGNPDQINLWLNNLHDLASLRVLKTVDEIKNELKKHLGKIPDDDNKFDPSEYQIAPFAEHDDEGSEIIMSSAPALSTPIPYTPSVVQPQQVRPTKPQVFVKEVTPAQTQTLAEDEFLEQLRKMSN